MSKDNQLQLPLEQSPVQEPHEEGSQTPFTTAVQSSSLKTSDIDRTAGSLIALNLTTSFFVLLMFGLWLTFQVSHMYKPLEVSLAARGNPGPNSGFMNNDIEEPAPAEVEVDKLWNEFEGINLPAFESRKEKEEYSAKITYKFRKWLSQNEYHHNVIYFKPHPTAKFICRYSRLRYTKEKSDDRMVGEVRENTVFSKEEKMQRMFLEMTSRMETLEKELKILKRRIRHFVWINPMYGASTFEVRAAALKTALPHVDFFLPAYDAKALHQLIDGLSKI